MDRIDDITLEEAYEFVKKGGYAIWSTPGNFTDMKVVGEENQVKTVMVLSKSMFLLGLSKKKGRFDVLASQGDFIDIWPSVKEKYPQLFQDGVKGEMLITP